MLIDEHGQPKRDRLRPGQAGRADEGLTASGEVMGTPSYMPPEQAAGDAELWARPPTSTALGAMLYCLLTGRPPFQAASAMETLLQVLDREPVAAAQLKRP